jgi:hypothetical protein
VSLIPAELRGPDVRQIRPEQTRSLRMIDLYRRALVIPGTPEIRIPGTPERVIPGTPDQIIPGRPQQVVSRSFRLGRAFVSDGEWIEDWADYDEIEINADLVENGRIQIYAKGRGIGQDAPFYVWEYRADFFQDVGTGLVTRLPTVVRLKIIRNSVFRVLPNGQLSTITVVALSPAWDAISFRISIPYNTASVVARTIQPATPPQTIPGFPDRVVPGTPDRIIPATPDTFAPGRVVTLAHTASRLIRVGGYRMIRDASMVALGATRLEFRDGRLYGVPVRGFAPSSPEAIAELRWILGGMPWWGGAWESALAGQWVRRAAWPDITQAVRYAAGAGTTRAVAVRESGNRVSTADFGAAEFLAEDWELLDGNAEPSQVDVTDWVFAVSGNTGVRGAAFAVVVQPGGGPGDGGGPTTPPPTTGLPQTGEGFVYLRNGTPTLVRARKLSDESLWRP